jgi:hypothetical protein
MLTIHMLIVDPISVASMHPDLFNTKVGTTQPPLIMTISLCFDIWQKPDSYRQDAPVVESCYLNKVFIETTGNQVSRQLPEFSHR